MSILLFSKALLTFWGGIKEKSALGKVALFVNTGWDIANQGIV